MGTFNDWSRKGRVAFSPLQTFFIKAVMIVIAVDACVSFTVSYTAEKFAAAIGDNSGLWANVEKAVYKLADADDFPEPRKAQLIAALKKISVKYGPYIAALVPPNDSVKP
ncbi:hypothetical protein [uncultured Bradyrhizobium sp.]|jgi:hypothetical protein|uniref:hypothetical protein n=1 Tax=uncultured Bradyrhizobium sp. TaxID=199684 RepID=UPI002625BCD6|nr:hypothetical protein [uncultured Bradyrhizobium sp.]